MFQQFKGKAVWSMARKLEFNRSNKTQLLQFSLLHFFSSFFFLCVSIFVFVNFETNEIKKYF